MSLLNRDDQNPTMLIKVLRLVQYNVEELLILLNISIVWTFNQLEKINYYLTFKWVCAILLIISLLNF